jgi:hypothetical protein
MPQVFPDGDYSHGATWMNANDRVSWERSFQQGTDSTRRMAEAALTADPGTPARMIRAAMTAPVIEQHGMKVSPTIAEVLNVGPSGYDTGHLYDRAPTDFSGTPAGIESGPSSSLNAY